jgi:hypothetical protein
VFQPFLPQTPRQMAIDNIFIRSNGLSLRWLPIPGKCPSRQRNPKNPARNFAVLATEPGRETVGASPSGSRGQSLPLYGKTA